LTKSVCYQEDAKGKLLGLASRISKFRRTLNPEEVAEFLGMTNASEPRRLHPSVAQMARLTTALRGEIHTALQAAGYLAAGVFYLITINVV
jgi:hypothetical protein